jgi:hypothetical protein
MTETELQQVEDFVNARIRTITIRRRIPIQQKLIEEGAMALFGEIWRYGACDLAKAWNFVGIHVKIRLKSGISKSFLEQLLQEFVV